MRLSRISCYLLSAALCLSAATVSVDSVWPPPNSTVFSSGNTITISGRIANISSRPEFYFAPSFGSCCYGSAGVVDEFNAVFNPVFGTGLPVNGVYTGPIARITGNPLVYIYDVTIGFSDGIDFDFITITHDVYVRQVPEPNATGLMAVGTAGLLFFGRCIRRHFRFTG